MITTSTAIGTRLIIRTTKEDGTLDSVYQNVRETCELVEFFTNPHTNATWAKVKRIDKKTGKYIKSSGKEAIWQEELRHLYLS